MDLFQRQHRVSVDSFVNPVEAQLNYSKSLSSSPSLDASSRRQQTEADVSVSLDMQYIVGRNQIASSCEYSNGSFASEGSRVPISLDDASFEAQTVKFEEPSGDSITTIEKWDTQKYEEIENSSSLKFLVTDSAHYAENTFENDNVRGCKKADLSRFLRKKEKNQANKSVSLIDNNTCNTRGYKSLSLLCENFIKLYGNHSNEEFFVDEVAEILHVERRRIYDIVNVLESLGIVVKKKRNHYKWQGVDRIPFTLIALKVSSEVENDVKQQNTSTIEAVDSLTCSSDEGSLSSQKDDDSERETGLVRHRNDQNDKFLGVLTQRFIKLFLESSESVISFQEIIRLLLGEQDKDMKSKTGIRRLYDIANILSALQLIQKTQKWNGEMAYEWLLSEIAYLHIFRSTKLHEEKINVSRKRDLSLSKQHHGNEEEKSKLPRRNETLEHCYNTTSNLTVSREQELKSFNEEDEEQEEENSAQVGRKIEKEKLIPNCRDWHMDATQRVHRLDDFGQFANAYVPNSFSGPDLSSLDHSTLQLQKSLAEFQHNVIRQWYQWFEQVPTTELIESTGISGSVGTSREMSRVAPHNFLPIPFYWSIRPLAGIAPIDDSSSICEPASTYSVKNENVEAEEEDRQQ
ncbi:hypothetical protein GpartN1_g558.t1 [Galdieria partita]|uniref:E2F/DP family winged-helix DNA-binding domain-containing protein n=1 Tax=Galdieria partita TaxID=83374 RepID=A0A9C7UMM6_9RHOD|nr:hypothetical protein GpartN1_g558.t1 [Galdieria partita]